MIYLKIKDKLITELSKSFDPKVNFDKRLRVSSDLQVFNFKEDKSVWKQKRGLLPEYFTVYFDDEYICGFDDTQTIEWVVLQFWKGFKHAYESGKIRLNPTTDTVPTAKKATILATTPEEKMAAQIVRKLNAK